MPVQQLQELFEVRQKKKSTNNQAQSPSNLAVGTGNFYLFYKVFKNEHPKYLFNLIPVGCTLHATRTETNIPLIKTAKLFQKFVHLSVIIEWNNIDSNLRNSKSISVFKEKILNFIRPSPNSVFDIRNPKGIKLITRLRLGLSHLREHKFKHSFQDTLNPLCNCGQDIESTTHFFLHCPFFINERRTLLSTIRSLDSKLLDFTNYDLTQTLLLFKQQFQNH